MFLLIRDLDDPFEYDGDTETGSADVSLQLLDYLDDRVARDIRAVETASRPTLA